MLHLSEARGRILKFYSSQFSNITLHFYCNNVYTVAGLSWFPVSGTWEDGELESSHPSQSITLIQFSTFDFLPFLFFLVEISAAAVVIGYHRVGSTQTPRRTSIGLRRGRGPKRGLCRAYTFSAELPRKNRVNDVELPR